MPTQEIASLPAEAKALRSRAAAWESCILRRDTSGAQTFITDDFTVVILQPVRAVVPRAQWLRTIAGYQIRDYQTEDEVVEVDGDLGIVMQRIRQLATVLGQDRSGVFIHTDIWRRRDGEWRVWRRHSTPLTAGPYPSASGV